MVIMSIPRRAGDIDAFMSAQLRQAAMAVQDAKITEGQLANGRTDAMSAQNVPQPQYGSVWTKSFHDASPVISLNAAAAPKWSAALDIDRQLAAGNPCPIATHVPFKASIADKQSEQQVDRQLYQPPVELVVLDSQLQRLGPSTPFRCTAVSAPIVNPRHLQQPLLSPVRCPASTSRKWAADAGTQTLPAWLAADAERMGEGQCVNRARPASANPSRQPHPFTAGRLQGTKHSNTSSPWRLVGKHAGANEEEPWVPAGLSGGWVKEQVAESTAAAWAAKGAAGTGIGSTQDAVDRCTAYTRKDDTAGDSYGDWRTCSPTSRRRAAQRARERARQQFEASAKYAAIGRAAARENAAAAAAAACTAATDNQPQHLQSTSPAGQIAGPDMLAASQTAEQTQTQGNLIGSKRFKTLPPPTQPWRPAGAAHKANQRTSAVQENHAASPAVPVPSSLRALINRSKKRLDLGPRHPGGSVVLRVLASDELNMDASDWLRSDISSSQSADTMPEAVMQVLEQLESAAIKDNMRDISVLEALSAHSELADVQAVSKETSSQEDTRSGYSWQSPAGHHEASVAALTAEEGDPLPVCITVSISSSAAASTVQQHEEELSAAVALDSPRPLTAHHLSRLAQSWAHGSTSEGRVPQSPPRQPGSPGVHYKHIHLHSSVGRQHGSPGVWYNHIDLQSPTTSAATAGQASLATCTLAAGQAVEKVEDDFSCLLCDSALACNADANFQLASNCPAGVAAADASTQSVQVPTAAAKCVNSESHNSIALSAQVLAALGPDLAARILGRPGPAEFAPLAAAQGAQPLWQQFSDHLPNTGDEAHQAAGDSIELSEGQSAAVALAGNTANILDGCVREHISSTLAQCVLNPCSGSSDGEGDNAPDQPVTNLPQDIEHLDATEEASALTGSAAAATAASLDHLILDEQDCIAIPVAAGGNNKASRHSSVRVSASGYLEPSNDANCYRTSVADVNMQHCVEGQEEIGALDRTLQTELNGLDLESASLEERLVKVAQHVPAGLPSSHRQSSTSVFSVAASQPLSDRSSELVVGDIQGSTSSVSVLPLRSFPLEGGDANNVRSHSVCFSSMEGSYMDNSVAESDFLDSDSSCCSK